MTDDPRLQQALIELLNLTFDQLRMCQDEFEHLRKETQRRNDLLDEVIRPIMEQQQDQQSDDWWRNGEEPPWAT